MKLNGYLRGMIVAGCVCGMIVGSGCRPKGKTPTGTGVTGGGDTIENKMAERPGSEGEPIQGLNLKNVQFAYDSFQITDSEVPKIKEVAEYMQANPNTRLVNEGNCDERGTAEYNVSLGENRAQAVRAYLIGLKVDGSRIQTKSYGKDKPLDEGHSEAAWSKNRRVEFVLYR